MHLDSGKPGKKKTWNRLLGGVGAVESLLWLMQLEKWRYLGQQLSSLLSSSMVKHTWRAAGMQMWHSWQITITDAAACVQMLRKILGFRDSWRANYNECMLEDSLHTRIERDGEVTKSSIERLTTISLHEAVTHHVITVWWSFNSGAGRQAATWNRKHAAACPCLAMHIGDARCAFHVLWSVIIIQSESSKSQKRKRKKISHGITMAEIIWKNT